MILLTTASHLTSMRWRHPHHGRLMVYRCWDRADETARAGVPWAVDNDCYNGFEPEPWKRMLLGLIGLPGCLFVNAPDVVGDHAATLALWNEWQPHLKRYGLPLAFVLQNGATIDEVPWADCAAVFIGGDTDWKLGADAAAIVAEAKRREKWVHMGRVNSLRRIRYAQGIGCDSVDGTKWAKFRDTWMPQGLNAMSAGEQTRMAL